MKTEIKTIFLLLSCTLLFTACTESNNGSKEPEFDYNEFCTKSENAMSEKCTQVCVEQPDMSWCGKSTARFTCPNDGTFKAVNPFTGEDLSFPEAKSISFAVPGSAILGTALLTKGDVDTYLYSKGSKLFIGDGTVNVELTSTITSIDTITVSDSLFYAAAATIDGMKIVPITYNSDKLEIAADDIKSLDILGGISEILIRASPDISGGSGTGLPDGMYVSLNKPLGDEAADGAVSNVEFVYMIDGSGNFWRSKFSSLLQGGCVERIFDASESRDDKDHLMPAKKIDVAGQYIAILTETAGTELTELPEEAKSQFDAYIEAEQIPGPIAEKFFWLAYHAAYPDESMQKIGIINLLDSETGTPKFANIDSDSGIVISDISLFGIKLFASAFVYDKSASPLSQNDPAAIFKAMEDVWKNVRSGSGENVHTDFVEKSHSTIAVVDISKTDPVPSTFDISYPEGTSAKTPSPFFIEIATGAGKAYLRGENRYFGYITVDNPSLTTLPLASGSLLTPYRTIFDTADNEIMTSFISELERIKIDEITVEMITTP